ncbi:MAG TPA: ABC transporter permease [Phycisphaerales bacterium]|nr:ABC transporter permease [Phycisphaerales bacterium]HIB50241.1 ABC transporter permease [Phycisphaerales bacterium]HIN83664.1 ABC transporter permease [Phycisphaerales bacterium]HIO19610.1 ABC transporter permease [Phycisphaerales bacterium]HIO52161.1 ABC transporter permease [Phycisphaerales bacterium]
MRRSSLTNLIGWRLVQLPFILLAVYTITFLLAWQIPGNPLEKDGRRPPKEVMEQMQAQYNLDNPMAFYTDYIWKASGLAWVSGERDGPVFNLGPSLRHENWTVNDILIAQLPVSITIGLCAILLALFIGLSAGVVSSIKPGSFIDVLSFGIAIIGISLPSFVIGVLLLITFSVWLQWFPISGWGTWKHLVLPSVALSLPFAAYIAQLTRVGMIEQLRSDHIRTARAKGLSEKSVILKHAMKNALLPVVSYLGPATAAAMTGSFVIEKVFAVPGIGTHFVDAVLGKDITVLMGIVLVYSTLLILFNLAVDVMYTFLDPRPS